MNWDDLRFVIAVARQGSLLGAARVLAVDHTTVGRRVADLEGALGMRLFARSTTGLVLTADGERLLPSLTRVEEAVLGLERASSKSGDVAGRVKVTSPESFGVAWLAPRLAVLSRQHPGLALALDPKGAVSDLGRREAEVALRTFRTKDPALSVRRACEIGHGVYMSRALHARAPIRTPADLAGRPLLIGEAKDPESRWLLALAGGATPVLSCVVALALVHACKAGAGVAVLPRYLGDAEPDLVHVPMPHPPRETLWLTVHRDVRTTPRVRLVIDHILDQCRRDAITLRGG